MSRGARGTPPFGGFYENSVTMFHPEPSPVFQKKTVTVEYPNALPSYVNAKVLHLLANQLIRLERLYRHQNIKMEPPYIKLLNYQNNQVVALVQHGPSIVKLIWRRSEETWIVLGDTLKIND